MRFFTSDTHFWHARIIELSNRPFRDVEHMNEEIILRWNSKVAPTDTVFHLGDVMLGQNFVEHLPLLGRLNGHKTLVVGNHDRMFGKMSTEKYDRWMNAYGEHFDDIVEAKLVTIGEHNVYLSHFPYDGDGEGKEDRYTEFRILDDGTTLVHGHTHSPKGITRSKRGTLQIHVGQDAWNYEPVSEEMISFIRGLDDERN